MFKRILFAGVMALGLIGTGTAGAATPVQHFKISMQAYGKTVVASIYKKGSFNTIAVNQTIPSTNFYDYSLNWSGDANNFGEYVVDDTSSQALAKRVNADTIRLTKKYLGSHIFFTHITSTTWLIKSHISGACEVDGGFYGNQSASFWVSNPNCTVASSIASSVLAAIHKVLAPQAVPTQAKVNLISSMSGDQNNESAIFYTNGSSFTISWLSVVQSDPGMFTLYLYPANNPNEYLEMIGSTTQTTTTTYLVHDDCSKGCYLKAYSSNVHYEVAAFY